ncbi:MAG: hypothetical protein K2J34_00420, partial [Muribaculaceae bacterium]|nr:hypothetical protein [Muribaculaceae bacterium]
ADKRLSLIIEDSTCRLEILGISHPGRKQDQQQPDKATEANAVCFQMVLHFIFFLLVNIKNLFTLKIFYSVETSAKQTGDRKSVICFAIA